MAPHDAATCIKDYMLMLVGRRAVDATWTVVCKEYPFLGAFRMQASFYTCREENR